MRKATFAAVLFILAAACSRVESGRLVTCKICGKELENTVKAQWVPLWDKDKYSVTRDQSYCQADGDQPVQYSVFVKCVRCGKIYRTFTESAPRRTEPKDQTRTEGYCSQACQTLASVDRGLDRGSRAVGDVIGRVSRGLFDGVARHAK